MFLRKTIPALFLLSGLVHSACGQLISEFTWDSNPVTQAAFGPNGTSVSGTATSSPGGSSGTNGLNAGPGSNNINLIVPGATFMVPGLDVSVDFLKKENGASFFALGSFDVGISTGAIYAKFLLNKSGVDTMLTFNSILPVPNDNAFHTYRFVYNNVSGVFTASEDGTVGFTYNGTPGRALSWTGATNVTIAGLMDGSGSNMPELDSLVVQKPPVVLPLDLLSFDAFTSGMFNELDWVTAQEMDTREFAIERSVDGVNYQAIGVVAALGNYSGNNDYQFTDRFPANTSYYRLKMTDMDGNFTYSSVKKLSSTIAISISCYPNPVTDYVNVRISHSEAATYQYTVITLDGKTMQSGIVKVDGAGGVVSVNLSAFPKGLVMLRVQDLLAQTTATFKILRK